MENEMNANFSHYEVLMILLIGALSEVYDSDEAMLKDLKENSPKLDHLGPKTRQEFTRLLEIFINSEEDSLKDVKVDLTLEWLVGKIQSGSTE